MEQQEFSVAVIATGDATRPELLSTLRAIDTREMSWRVHGGGLDPSELDVVELAGQLEGVQTVVADVVGKDEPTVRRWLSLLGPIANERGLVALGDCPDLEDSALMAGADEYLPLSKLEVDVLCRAVVRSELRARVRRSGRRSETRRIIERLPDGLMVVDGNGAVRFANEAAERLLGQPSRSLVGTSFGAPASEGERLEFNTVRDGDDGPRVVTLEMHVVAIGWEGEQAYLGSLRDVTDRKRQTEEAREAVDRRDQFLAILSHELRNPLAALTMASSLIARPEASRAIIDESIGMMGKQVSSMTRLLDDLLDVSRVSRGRIELNLEPVRLPNLVTECVATVRPRIDGKQQRVEVRIEESEALETRGDPQRLRQVVQNLLTNASKYSPKETTIEVALRRSGDEIVLSVKDEGEGLDAASLEDVFQPFVQLGVTLDRSDGGLGIGLALVDKLVQLHNGSVHALSDGPGTGSEFVVTLPVHVASEGVATSESTDQSVVAEHRPRTIVLVEDQEAVRNTTRWLIESLGHDVHVAADGREGIEVIRRIAPDLAFVDIGLPVVDGFEVAETVRRTHPESDTIKLVALTGYGQEKDRLRSRQAGFDFHITKPIDEQRLRSVITELDETARPAG